MSGHRRIVLVALAAIAALSLGITAASAKPQQGVTLKSLFPVENRAGWDVMIANFQRQFPNVKVEPQYVPGSQYAALLLTQLQAGSAADILSINAGASSNFATYALGSQGKLLDLTKNSPWIKRIPKDARKYVTIKGRVYGFPANFTVNGLVYNVDLFRQLGLRIPTRFSELLTLCRTVAAAGKIPIAFGGAAINAPINLTNMMGTSFVYGIDPGWTLKRIQKKVTFASSPLWQRLLAAILEMRAANCFPPSPAAVTAPAQYAMVANQQAVMMPATTGEFSIVKAINPAINLKSFPFPADDPKNTNVSLSSAQYSLVVNKATQFPKEAKAFVDFVARPKQNSLMAKVNFNIAGDDLRKGILPDFLSDMVPLFKASKYLLTFAAGWPRPDKGMYIPNLTVLQIPGLFTGQRTPQQILDAMDALWDKP